MGLKDLLSTCFRCSQEVVGTGSESDVLVAPARARASTVSSQEGYGTMSMTLNHTPQRPRFPLMASPPRATDQQRARMSEISRAAGSHMRPIGNPLLGQGRGCTSPTLRSINPPSSRGSSPTPPRHPSPPTGIQTIGEHDHMHSHEHEHDHDHDHDHDHKARTGSDASEFSTGGISVLTRSSSCSRDAVVDASGVVHKSIFGGDTSAQSPPSGGRRASGSRPSGTGRRRRAR